MAMTLQKRRQRDSELAVGQFVTDRVRIGPDRTMTSSADLYGAYVEWFTDLKERGKIPMWPKGTPTWGCDTHGSEREFTKWVLIAHTMFARLLVGYGIYRVRVTGRPYYVCSVLAAEPT